MVFAVAELAGWLAPPARAEHVAFGSVLGADKQDVQDPRAARPCALVDLLDEAVAARRAPSIAEKNPELDAETRADVARAVGIGAVKYADLSSDRIKDYVFDWDRMLAFEGNTAPYLQYAHARIRSIFRKADGRPVAARRAAIVVAAPAERALALELLALRRARCTRWPTTLEPHRLCTYLFELADGVHRPSTRLPGAAGRRATTSAARGSRSAI